MAIRNYANTGQTSTLTAAIGATDTSVTVAGYAGDPTPPFTAALARGTVTEEVVLVTAVAGSTLTIQRGYDGTSAQAQGAGTTFQEVVVAQDFREANAHVNATVAVHGLAAGSAVVGTTDAQSLTNKTLIAPTLSSPTFSGSTTMAAVTITTLTVSGATALAAFSASALASLNGGATVPTGQKITLTDAPATGTDAVNKTYVDGAVGGATGSSSAATANLLVKRDAAARAQFADPSAAADAATKNYVDTGAAAKLNRASTNNSISTSYTLVATDASTDVVLHSTAAAAITVTLPSDASVTIAQNVPIPWRQYGAGQITFAAGAGATLVSRGAATKSAGQYAEGIVTKVAANTWLLSGDVTP